MLLVTVYTSIPEQPGVLVLRRDTDGFLYDNSDATFKAIPVEGYFVATEDDDIPGLFRWSISQTWDGLYQFFWYPSASMDVAPTVWSIYLVAGERKIPREYGAGDSLGTGDVRFVWYEYEEGHSGDPAFAVSDVTVSAYNNADAEGDPEASGVTDEIGRIIFYLNEGTYYFFRKKSGRIFSNPISVEVG